MTKSMNNKVSCVIFDCDGTLVDSETLCCQALVNIFTNYGANITLDECLARFQGGKLADILMATRQLTGVSVSLDILEPLYRKEVSELFEQYLQPINGAVELIESLQNKKIEMCVASNAPVSKLEHSLGLTGLLAQFHGRLFSAFDTNTWKPEPDLLYYAAMNMGVKTNECLFVDDTPNGVQAGINAGMKTIYFQSNKDAVDIEHPLVTRIYELKDIERFIS
ncbi:6-phosphogluconate phosphatase [Vibrio sp. Of7-15]|uniref:6-phosphogluconate phosphatase n=1 Tax=Vibrio sp. Of7-15 TaxID=2724879 RepID=UPI001EF37B0A|nr:6-phosphogluconate phosphatase [Vibrio sp. Of7-15]MCG7495557.1 6-phosphogluconate phosphatase [Vibrio sp. Of7-15]